MPFRNRAVTILLLLTVCAVYTPAQRRAKAADDDGSKFTTIGNISATITNFGTIGNRFLTRPVQPSAQYPKGSGVEHISLAGLWIGAVSQKDGAAHVSTAATDVNPSAGQSVTLGYELTNDPGAGIKQRSTLPFDQFYDQFAVSHQDLVMDFTDRNRRSGSDTIPEHSPLGVNIHLETYAWNFPFADNFIMLNYTIKNVGTDTLIDMYVGLWDNSIIQNLNLSGTTISGHMGKSYLDSLRMMYTFDFNGAFITSSNQRTLTNSYLGLKLLGATPFPLKDSAVGRYYSNTVIDSLGSLRKNAFYNAWQFNSQSNPYTEFQFPLNDDRKYQRLKSSLPIGKIETLNRPSAVTSTDGTPGQAPNSFIDLLSVGPFRALRPGDSIQVCFAVITAKKSGLALPSDDYLTVTGPQLRKNLLASAGWAQKAYDGEDVNGNNKLDANEDSDGDGKITRFTLPQPPRQPKVHAVVENKKAIIYWDKVQAEQTPDPITQKLDFEGYKIYRSNAGADIGNASDFLLSMNLAADFDRADNTVGYNTGFAAIKLSAPVKFPGDTTEYWYRYPPANDPVSNLNGWQYLYGVSAYDQGDSAIGVASLESATVIKRVVTGTAPTSAASDEIGVYPNPYYVNAAWDQVGERSRKIYFYNLPSKAEIKIFTLTGDLVAELDHDAATYNGTDIKWFRDFSGIGVPGQFSGGEHAWDLITKYDQALASGLYLFTVKDRATGDVKRGKFAIVK